MRGHREGRVGWMAGASDGEGGCYCDFIGELYRELNVMIILVNRLNTYWSQLNRLQLAIEKAVL